MNYQEFIGQMDRLKAVYGESSYPNERVTRLFDSTRTLTYENWTEVVNRLIDECKYAPLKKEIYEAAKNFLPKLPSASDLIIEAIIEKKKKCGCEELKSCANCFCKLCGNTGLVDVFEINALGGPNSFRCFDPFCTASKFRREVLWSETFSRKWMLCKWTDNSQKIWAIANKEKIKLDPRMLSYYWSEIGEENPNTPELIEINKKNQKAMKETWNHMMEKIKEGTWIDD